MGHWLLRGENLDERREEWEMLSWWLSGDETPPTESSCIGGHPCINNSGFNWQIQILNHESKDVWVRDALIFLRDYLGFFSRKMGGGGHLNSQNFCRSTKYFFVCQIHSEVQKHVLERGGGDIWSILSPKVHLISFISEKNRSFGNLGGDPLFPKVNVKYWQNINFLVKTKKCS